MLSLKEILITMEIFKLNIIKQIPVDCVSKFNTEKRISGRDYT